MHILIEWLSLICKKKNMGYVYQKWLELSHSPQPLVAPLAPPWVPPLGALADLPSASQVDGMKNHPMLLQANHSHS